MNLPVLDCPQDAIDDAVVSPGSSAVQAIPPAGVGEDLHELQARRLTALNGVEDFELTEAWLSTLLIIPEPPPTLTFYSLLMLLQV